jgi:uncharacterized protein YjbI with pentapeptide repeats
MALALLFAIWWLWWRLPKRQIARLALTIRDPKARADTEDNFRKTVGQVLGGAAVLIGAGLAYWQFTQQQQTAYQQILTQQKAAEDSRNASQALLISNQVSKGFEQLAGKEMAMRLGGIYALEGVMNTSEQYREPVWEALCAYVRDSTKGNGGDETATDVQAALTVIGRRKLGGADYLNLRSSRIPKADLRGAYLAGSNLSRANLTGSDLSSTKLNNTDLSGANLSRANLFDADLTHTDLAGANLSDTDLGLADLSHTNLTDADLSGADLARADNLTQVQLDQACGKPKALPPGLTLDKPCPSPPTAR